jgi:hypothetical protein
VSGIENTPETYQEFLKKCLPVKNEEGRTPQEAMQACAIDYKSTTGKEPEIPELRGQLYLISSEECPSCEDAKAHFKEDIEKDAIKVLTIDDDKGWEIIRTLELREVPILVLEKADDGSYCKINPDGVVDSCTLPKKE